MNKNYDSHLNIIETKLRGLRIKLTEKCSWQCSFCHNEGGMVTSDLQWDAELENIIRLINSHINLSEIHFTGGEPTKNPNIVEITAALTAMGLEVKTTTNGQFEADNLKNLINAGLKSINFSMHSINPSRFLKLQQGRGIWWSKKSSVKNINILNKKIENLIWAKKQIKKQKENILLAKKKGANVKINTVVSGEGDFCNIKEIFEWAKKNKVSIRLLNDLGNGLESAKAITKFVNQIGAREISRKITYGSSSYSVIYKTSDGYEFGVKKIKENKLESMCRECPRAKNNTCEEQFYDIRLQKNNNGKYYIILCIQESNKRTRMTVNNFLKSDQLKDIINSLK